MRVICRNGNFVNEAGAELLNGANGSNIVSVARDRHSIRNRLNKRRNCTTRLKRIAISAKPLTDLESNMTGTNPNMICVTDSEIDVTDIRIVREHNAEMIGGNKIARRIAGNNSNKAQSHRAEGQNLRRFLVTISVTQLHALKLSPQEHVVAAFGFVTLKPPCNASR